MRHYKPILVTFTAIILVCSIPISASAIDPWSEELAYYTYNIVDPEDYVSTATSPWYDVTLYGTQICGRVHCRGGHVDKAFFLWIPFMGYYLVVCQESDMRIDFVNERTGRNCFYHCYSYGQDLQQTYCSFSGIGALSRDNLACFQDVFLGRVWVFIMIASDASGDPDRGMRSSVGNYGLPTPDEEEEILKKIRENSGTDKPFPSGSATAEILGGTKGEKQTYPDGTPVPTNQAGNPVPTNEFGQTMPTLPNGKPVPTYPNGSPAQYYTDPDGTYHTVPYTIYDNANNESDVNDHFSRFNDMISDLDDLSSIMESNASDLSVHVDGTRGLVDDVLSWFPAPVIAIMVCGVIMIIAVKITGSGKS